MRRGEIWTVAAGQGYAGKPRPCVIVRDDSFDSTNSVTVSVFTTDPTDAPLFRILIEPSDGNGLEAASRIMADKIVTVPRAKLGERIGRLADDDVVRVNQAMLVFLGLAGAPRAG